MLGITFYVLFAFSFSSNLIGAAPAPRGGAGLQQVLPVLDDETMQATFGTSHYHSKTMRGNIGIFHTSGDQWTDAQLSEYFLTGIFQHYVHELCGMDMELGVCNFKKILGVDIFDPALHADTIAALNTAVFKLKENPIFINLGTCFHRNKINLEKCNDNYTSLYKAHENSGVLKNCDAPEKMTAKELRAAAARSKQVSIMDIIDRTAIDQQTAFYHWMKEILEGAVDYIKRAYDASGALPALDDEELIALSTRVPAFMEWPVYKALRP
jgi:hypothetical protein